MGSKQVEGGRPVSTRKKKRRKEKLGGRGEVRPAAKQNINTHRKMEESAFKVRVCRDLW